MDIQCLFWNTISSLSPHPAVAHSLLSFTGCIISETVDHTDVCWWRMIHSYLNWDIMQRALPWLYGHQGTHPSTGWWLMQPSCIIESIACAGLRESNGVLLEMWVVIHFYKNRYFVWTCVSSRTNACFCYPNEASAHLKNSQINWFIEKNNNFFHESGWSGVSFPYNDIGIVA